MHWLMTGVDTSFPFVAGYYDEPTECCFGDPSWGTAAGAEREMKYTFGGMNNTGILERECLF
jgi:hypothetical protein